MEVGDEVIIKIIIIINAIDTHYGHCSLINYINVCALICPYILCMIVVVA